MSHGKKDSQSHARRKHVQVEEIAVDGFIEHPEIR